MAAPTERAHRAFISYSHDDDAHRAAVLALAQGLRRGGVDAWIDRFEPDPEAGWASWMRDQVSRAATILVVPSKTWQRRFYGKEEPDRGKGVRWEGLILTDLLYHRRQPEKRIRAVLVGNAREEFIPDVLSTHSFYRGCVEALAFIRGAVGVDPAPLGEGIVRWTEAPAGEHLHPRADLEELLLSFYSDNHDLRGDLRRLPRADRLAPRLDSTDVSRMRFVRSAVGALEDLGAIDGELWAMLRGARERRTDEVDVVEARYR